MPLKHGKYQRRVNQRGCSTKRETYQTQSDSHSADAGVGRK